MASEVNQFPDDRGFCIHQDHMANGQAQQLHGGYFDAEGNTYIVGWVDDGRITKLTRQA